MLCSRTIRRFDIPGEPGEWVEMHLLAPAQIRAIREQAKADVAALPEDEQANESGALMMERVLAHCVVAWSYAEADGAAIPVTPENLADLDYAMQMWALNVAIGNEPEAESGKD